jgi:hypothetical protein
MPNYPRIDLDNPYLSRRSDMDIVDSKPWGLGMWTQSHMGSRNMDSKPYGV